MKKYTCRDIIAIEDEAKELSNKLNFHKVVYKGEQCDLCPYHKLCDEVKEQVKLNDGNNYSLCGFIRRVTSLLRVEEPLEYISVFRIIQKELNNLIDN